MSKMTNESGMTLLELLIVVVIMGLIATLGSIQLTGYLQRAKADTAKLQMNELATALDLFHVDTGRYPSSAEGLSVLNVNEAGLQNWRGPYLRRLKVEDPWGRPYGYRSPSPKGVYELTSFGSDGVAGGVREAADIEYVPDF